MFNRNATVSEVMTREVMFIRPDDTMQKVAEIFGSKSFHHLPVVDDEGKIVGVVSSTDFHMLEDHFTLFKKREAVSLNTAIMRSMLVSEVMSTKLATIAPTDTLESAVGIFRENLFHALPVVDNKKKLLGIITPFDIMVWAFRPDAMSVE